jgi:RNA polymerase sigma-70 factor (ECF subfamily)
VIADSIRLLARKLISIDGSSVRETANRLHMTEGAVRVALHRALKTLAGLYRGLEFGIGSAAPFTAALKQCG